MRYDEGICMHGVVKNFQKTMNVINIIGKVTAIEAEKNETRSFQVSTNRTVIGEGDIPVRQEVIHPVIARGRWLRHFNDGTINVNDEIAVEGNMINSDGKYMVEANDIIIL